LAHGAFTTGSWITRRSDGFENAMTPDFFNKGFQLLKEGKADVLLPLKLEAGGRLVPWDPKAG
jgi:hypothetical protein